MIIYTATTNEWNKIKDKNEFVSDNYNNEGFIHCSYPKQTTKVLNKHYKNEKIIILLMIDENKLQSKCLFEDLKNKGEKFPHVYGSINTNSIIKTLEVKPNKDGTFDEETILNLLKI